MSSGLNSARQKQKIVTYPLICKSVRRGTISCTPFWFCFTGCDTVAQFSGRGKKTARDLWRSYPLVTETFVRLAGLCDLEPGDKDHLKKFEGLLYDRTTSLANVNECRRNHFVKKAVLSIATIYSLEQYCVPKFGPL